MMSHISLRVILLLACAGCVFGLRNTRADDGQGGIKQSSVYLLRPTDLLSLLTEDSFPGQKAPLPLSSAPKDWLTAHDALLLIAFAEDTTTCRRAHNTLSSYWSEKPSTVGKEARKLIHGYIKGLYPPIVAPTTDLAKLKILLVKKYQDQVMEERSNGSKED